MTTRACIYTRVSTDHQEEGTSLDTQLAACRLFAAGYGWEVVAEIAEVYSAGGLDRPRLNEVRRLAASGGFDILLAHKQERISREQTDTGILHKELSDRGVRIWTVLEGEFDQTPMGKFMVSARAFAAEVDRAQRREASMRGQKAKIAGGRMLGGHPALFGYRFRDATKSAYDPDPAEAPVVRRIFREYVAGRAMRKIALGLTADGILPPGHREGGNPRWSHTSVDVILRHPGYKGEAWGWAWRTAKGRRKALDRENGIRLPDGTVPALVTEAEWEAAQTARERNRRHNVGTTREP